MSESAEFPRHPRDGVERLVEEVRALRREVSELRNNLLKQAGMSVEPDLVRFGGAVAIEGTLSLPAGIIDNDALANPMTFRSTWGSSEAFAMPGGSVALAHCQITVPAGFTEMLFYTTASLRARNDEGSWEFLRARIDYQINSTGPIYSTVPTRVDVQNGRPGTVVVPGIWSESVTPGDVWRFWVDGWTEEPWSADPDNYAVLEVACLFTR